MNFKKIYCFIFFSALILQSCIKDDIIKDEVEPKVQITSTLDTLAIDDTFQFEAIYTNNVGTIEAVELEWMSSNSSVISITTTGLAQALQLGDSYISVHYDNGIEILKDSVNIIAGDTTTSSPNLRTGSIATTSTYTLTGDFILKEEGDHLLLQFADNYEASSSLPGLYVYLTNNPSTNVNAFEIAAVQVFSGAHSYTINNVGILDYNYVLYYCAPFNVKVGDGEIF